MDAPPPSDVRNEPLARSEAAPRVRAARAEDLPAMADIYNEGIRERVATFETRERTAEDLRPWLTDPIRPVLVAHEPDDERHVLGWVAASAYRSRECYAGIAEFSVYVRGTARGRGVGHLLMETFLPACARAGLWKVLSRVFPENTASRRLLAAHGFREVGTYRRHARLDGVWRDVVIVERSLGESRDDFGSDDGADQDWSASASSSSSSPS